MLWKTCKDVFKCSNNDDLPSIPVVTSSTLTTDGQNVIEGASDATVMLTLRVVAAANPAAYVA